MKNLLLNKKCYFLIIFIILQFSAISILTAVIDAEIPQNSEDDNDFYSTTTFKDGSTCKISKDLKQEIAGYQNVVNEIINEIVNGRFAGDTFNSLQNMTDVCGSRLSGSQNLETAIDFMIDEFNKHNFENVYTESAPVRHWVRGFESVEMINPRKAHIQVLGLGNTIGTPDEGILADIVAVKSFDELQNLPDEMVLGKIVVYAQDFLGYRETMHYRINGAAEAAKKGAAAALIKSITPFSIGSPHTGYQSYVDGIPKIPVGCITVEDANIIYRLSLVGNVTLHLIMKHENLPDVESRNLIVEHVGTNNLSNKSVVILSGHFDSWDVGVGAMDDGAGTYSAWKSLQYLKELGLRPKRTLRAILWTGEEFGLLGATQYEKDHKATEQEEFNFMMESDSGVFTPEGLGFAGNSDAKCILTEILKLMGNLNATEVFDGTNSPDLNRWLNRGFPGASLKTANDKYFWFHHTAGDNMDLLNSDDLDKGTALFAATAYVIADLSIDMPRNTILV